MKKTLVTALTTALVVGAASTTFAAANPFSDVPADHWAYDAVAQLAKDGVIEGYGDGTYQGSNSITRYEMAQMVAKAMAKEDQANAADKAMIDKLAAEFSDELNNLGVRVSNLEKKVDNVKFGGEVRYTYTSAHLQDQPSTARTNTNRIRLRLNVAAEVNDHWTAKTRIDYNTNMDSSTNASTNVPRAYVEGTYGTTKIDLGKVPYFSDLDGGMMSDDNVSGGQVTFGKDFMTVLTAGRYNMNNNGDMGFVSSSKSTYVATNASVGNIQSIQFMYNSKKSKLSGGAAYYHIGDRDFSGTSFSKYGTDKKNANIWEVAAKYQFTPNIALAGAYARNTDAENYKNASSVELDYKGAQPVNKGSFGIYAAYRNLGTYAVIHPTYDAVAANNKGWEIGTQYVFAKNIMGTARYFRGKEISSDKDLSRIFGQVQFYF